MHRNTLPSKADENIAVACRSITRDFGEGQAKVRVLHGVDLVIPLGKTTFLVGPSGCGKTTLISIIAGLLTPTSGQVHVLDREITKLRGGRLVSFRAQTLGFIFQQFNLIPALTAAENAAVSLVVQGHTLAAAKRKSSVLLDKLGMSSNANKYPNQLSGGQQQRVAIARALVHDPRIVICDEPTASLDTESGYAVMQLMQEVANSPQRAVIVVTHDNRIYGFADLIASMSDGRILDVSAQPDTESTRSESEKSSH
ncbi:ABC transporter ATP-binding protein [Pirellula sp. SH-Sr6A]|uniref:ABC transporter ATP-binding protein n=1 Tax=Pirellula sp. SH-Sr6A TaxID=1632865 RepID=UPI001F0A9155|nr:ABC transporter ATP-binding protein [Pirellula sp. SH-Sr6A]